MPSTICCSNSFDRSPCFPGGGCASGPVVEGQVFSRIILPLSKPIIAVVAMLRSTAPGGFSTYLSLVLPSRSRQNGDAAALYNAQSQLYSLSGPAVSEYCVCHFPTNYHLLYFQSILGGRRSLGGGQGMMLRGDWGRVRLDMRDPQFAIIMAVICFLYAY